MRHAALLALASLPLLAGCVDRPRTTPTEPPAEAAAAAPAQAAAVERESTVCAAYRRQLASARAALARAPGDRATAETVETYEAVLADACP